MITLRSYLSTFSWLKWAAVAVAALFLFGLAFQGGSSCASHRRDKAFEEKEAKAVEAREQLTLERDAAITRANDYERVAAEAEAKRATFESLVNALGAKADELKVKAENEEKKFDEEMAAIGAAIDPVERCRRICQRLRLSTADCACE